MPAHLVARPSCQRQSPQLQTGSLPSLSRPENERASQWRPRGSSAWTLRTSLRLMLRQLRLDPGGPWKVPELLGTRPIDQFRYSRSLPARCLACPLRAGVSRMQLRPIVTGQGVCCMRSPWSRYLVEWRSPPSTTVAEVRTEGPKALAFRLGSR
jgi:hypothetical protein